MAEADLDRNEAATPYKLQKARERGQVSKSPDVVSATVFGVSMVFFAWYGWKTWLSLIQFARVLMMQAGRLDGSGAALWALVAHATLGGMSMLAPFFVTLLIAAVVANILQTGPVLSADPLKADWNRLNPATGFKRLFSLRTLFDAGRAVIKPLLLCLVTYHALKSLLPQFYHLSGLAPLSFVRTLVDDIVSLGLKIAMMLAVIALADLIYTRREFSKKMRMSRRDVKDEFRMREGDPRIRSRLRELRRETLKRSQSLRNTRDADVLITNPTHVAVALRYEHGKMQAPQMVAKGAGVFAAVMRSIAARHRVPIVQNPALARQLFLRLEVDQSVPPELYAQVARIIVWIFAMRKSGRTAGVSEVQVNRGAAV